MLWRTCLIFLFVASALANESNNKEWLEVEIAQGTVRGLRDPNEDLYIFRNIPYATAPTGDQKFKGPLEPPTWTGTFNLSDKNIVCPQFVMINDENLLMQENCLITNIYKPDTKEQNLSVLVIVHGGAFQVASGDWLKYKGLMRTKDFILVNFNYRLGIHGFLCLGTEDAPGNAGMKDQVALLRWVQQNIAAFGGNPDDVTIAGYSAGSASVDLLMISKLAEGLFYKVIPESGANLAVFSIQSDPLQIAKDHAKKLNFTNVDDINALEEFYKTLPFTVLTSDPFLDKTDSTFNFVPCVENSDDTAFLSESPLNILKNNKYKKVPMLYGFANMEGLMRIEFFDTKWKDGMNQKFSDYLPADLKFESDFEREEVAKKIKEFYFGNKPVDESNVLRYVDYFSDVLFAYSTLRAVKLHADNGHNQVYLYEYSFVDERTPVVPHTNVRGANHCHQSMAVADGDTFHVQTEDDITEEHRNMKKILREIWHNFIKTGKPVPEGSSLPAWPAAGADTSPHMSLGQKIELRGKLLEENVKFWDDIYSKYYREPIPPPKPSASSHTEL